MTQPLNVLITIDTETWPRTPGWRESHLEEDIRREILGATPNGEFGLIYQMDVLNAHGLKAVFLVEALFACAVGIEPLRRIVALIQQRGHEIQLHIHTEWLQWMSEPILPGRTGQNLKDFTAAEQDRLVGCALANLTAAGAAPVEAFRAGNYGANFDTLRALARHGLRYDTSYNIYYLDADCGLRTAEPLLQPVELAGIVEYPITFFQDWPGHYRHLQLCACSLAEICHALRSARARGWHAAVLVSHGFELLRQRKRPGPLAQADWSVIRRFEQLCRFLGAHRDEFRTVGFADLEPVPPPPVPPGRPLRSNVVRTARRYAEQLARRLA